VPDRLLLGGSVCGQETTLGRLLLEALLGLGVLESTFSGRR
jgi:hypothetical protein